MEEKKKFVKSQIEVLKIETQEFIAGSCGSYCDDCADCETDGVPCLEDFGF